MFNKPRTFLAASFFIQNLSLACVGCGQDSFTPKMLMVGSFFALLPMGLAAGIGWILYRDYKAKNNPTKKP